MLSSGNDESYHDVNNEARMRNDGQIIGSGFHNTEERQGLGQVTLDSDVCFKISIYCNSNFRFMRNLENKEVISIMYQLKKDL